MARARLAEWLQLQQDITALEEKHSELLDLIQFSEEEFHPDTLVPATPDSTNTGVIRGGSCLPTLNAMFVDDNLMANIWRFLRPALAASVEALFIILGEPDEKLRKSPLSMDKYYESRCSHSRKQLGYLINTRLLTVSITAERRAEILDILTTT